MVGEEVLLNSGDFAFGALTGILATIAVFLIILAVVLLIVLYVYYALAFQSIARKLKYKNSWLAWIPFANWAMILQLGNISWGWIFLILIPVLGWIALLVLIIIAFWRISEKAGYARALSLLMLISVARLIVIGIVAWQKDSYSKKR